MDCPKCYSENTVVEIVYGLPGPGLFEKAARGEVKLGGCITGKDDHADYYCNECEARFLKDDYWDMIDSRWIRTN